MLVKIIKNPIKDVFAFLANPVNLPKWTVHRALYQKNGGWYEIRPDKHGGLSDIALNVTSEMTNPYKAQITFVWEKGNTVLFELTATRKGFTHTAISFPEGLNIKYRKAVEDLVEAELDILQALLEDGSTQNIPAAHWYKLQSYHLKMYR